MYKLKSPDNLSSVLKAKKGTGSNNAAQPARKRRKLDTPPAKAVPEESFPLHLRSFQWSVGFESNASDESILGFLGETRIESISVRAQDVAYWRGALDFSSILYFSLTTPGYALNFIASGETETSGSELWQLLQHAVTYITPKANSQFYCIFKIAPVDSQEVSFHLDVRCRNASLYEEIPFRDAQLQFFNLVTGTANQESVSAWSPRDFYDSVYVPPKDDQSAQELEISDIHSTLFAYQKRTIQWMLQREGVDISGNALSIPAESTRSDGWENSTTADGQSISVNSWLGLASTDQNLIAGPYTNVSGGILSEEMGLGKTVEILALVAKHKRDSTKDDHQSPDSALPATDATLIIAPESIITQWAAEINLHAPAMRTLVYPGIRNGGVEKMRELREQIQQSDVVLCSYNTLAREVYFARDPPKRNMRYKHEGKHERIRSPLVSFHWWRVVLDECQMVESGVSNAAEVALQIPRRHAWAASGTPLRKDPSDVYGLLRFLQLCPYSWSKKLWERLLSNHQPIFRELIHSIVLRHTKQQVRDEIELPPQKRIVSTVSLTQIEDQHYSDTFERMCQRIGLSSEGAPLTGDWDPDNPSVVEQMRIALTQLRQLCLHPDVGGRNRRALGGRLDEVLRTVEDVLKVMIEQNETGLKADERQFHMVRLRKGQILEEEKRTQEALQLWQEILMQIQPAVKLARAALGEAVIKTKLDEGSQPEITAKKNHLGALRNRLRSLLEVEHIAQFFMGNAYFQLKENEDITDPGSEGFKRLEKLEVEQYDAAKAIRVELLIEPREAAQKQIAELDELSKDYKDHSKAISAGLPGVDERGGIETRESFADLDELAEQYTILLHQIVEWRDKLVELLSKPLIDEKDDDLEGDEYETSTKEQDEVYARMDVFRAAVSDLSEVLTGQENALTKSEIAGWTKLAQEKKGNAPELMLEMLQKRAQLKPDKNLGSVRGILAKLRSLEGQFKSLDDRRNMEAVMMNTVSTRTRRALSQQEKIVALLSRDVNGFINVQNARLEFYRQLQAISDLVAPFPPPEEEEEALKTAQLSPEEQATKHAKRVDQAKTKLLREEVDLEASIRRKSSQQRYLAHLRDGGRGPDRKCIICQDDGHEIAVLTTCGHLFCKECITAWLKEHNKCPQCRANINSRSELYQISYKPQELRMEVENTKESTAETDTSSSVEDSSRLTSIYSEISTEQLNQIKSIDLEHNFSTKIDFIARHIIWLRTSDPGCKTVIFSQFSTFCPNRLSQAFDRLNIRYAEVGGKGVDRFKHDPSIECLLMHAGSQASGMNLVQASHILLCEPLVNTAIELQAIARVHRIGQHRPTTIWMYLVENTVEKAIYDISVERRLDHIGRKTEKRSRTTTPKIGGEDDVQAADAQDMDDKPLTTLLSKSGEGGEIVGKEDLWKCFFGHTRSQRDLGALDIPGDDAADGSNQS